MITPSTAGLSRYHSCVSSLLTEMKSLPKKTPVTPSTSNSRSASGERLASSKLAKLAVPASPITARPGRNFSVAGFGVCSV